MAPPPQQLVLAASSADAGVAAWDLRTGAEAIHHRPCASRPRALAAVANRFLAAAQAPAGNSNPIHYYHWDKPQVAVKSFPAEPIRALIADPEGSYLIGGGVSGDIFFWEAVTSLASSTDGLLLVSGSEDGNVRVWDTRSQQVTRKFKHSQGPVTNVLIVTPKRVNLPPLQPLRKVCSANGEVEQRAVILPHPENDVHIAGNLSSNLLERCLDELQERVW